MRLVHKRVGVLIASAAAVVCAACSVISDFNSVDTSNDSTISADAEAFEDSTATDASSTRDGAASDAGTIDAASPRFCASIDATACQDFDDNEQGLDEVKDCKKSISSEALDSVVVKSAPHSLVIRLTGPGVASCYYTKTSDAPANKTFLRADFEINISQPPDDAEVSFAMLRIGGPSQNRVRLTQSASGTRIQDYLPPEAGAVFIPATSSNWAKSIEAGTWAQVSVEVDIKDAAKPVASVRLNGELVVDKYELAKPWVAGNAFAHIGVESATGAPIEVRVDNVAIYAR